MSYEMRITHSGRFEVTRDGIPGSLGRAFSVRGAAEAYLTHRREWAAQLSQINADRREKQAPHQETYDAILQSPELRGLRRDIQEAYGEACEVSRRAAAAQRAVAYGTGISCLGRDIGAARQTEADRQADDADDEWETYDSLFSGYHRRLVMLMRAAGIPDDLFFQTNQ